MSIFASFPFVRLLFPFVMGIIIAIYANFNSHCWIYLSVLLVLLICAETFLFKLSSHYTLRYCSGILFALSLILLGIALTVLNNQLIAPNHFSKVNAETYSGVIVESPIEKSKCYKVILKVDRIKSGVTWVPTTGKLLCYLEKKSIDEPRTGDRILFQSTLKEIDEPKNPGQFNYKQYLYYHNIYHQVYLYSSSWNRTGREGSWLKNTAYDIRKELIRSFKENGLKDDQLAVASALLFGATDLLEPGLIRSYAGTGALHVLSVSGLHVAIIYGFLQLILSFLKQRKNGKIIIGVIILLFIWFYAILTGLTPSVLRSTTMFTFIVIGEILSRKSSVFNSVAASAFVLLCIDPFLIMEVGFQLSYLAVTGIILIYPIIHRQFRFNTWLAKQIWSITSVSIAAQIATFPLGLLYFHQFPNYFIFSNLLIIPLSGLILYTGVIASAFYFIPCIQKFFVILLDYSIWIMNKLVGWIEQLPFALMEGISITMLETGLLYSGLLAWLLWYNTSKPTYIKFVLGSLACITILQFCENIEQQNQEQLIVYHAPKHTAIDLIKSNSHTFISDSSFYHNPDQLLFNVKHNWDNLNLELPKVIFNKHISTNGIEKKYFYAGGKSICLLDGEYNYKTDPIVKTSILILSQNPGIDLTKIPEHYRPETVIADSSNKKSRIRRWKEQAEKIKLRFVDINSSGSFILNF